MSNKNNRYPRLVISGASSSSCKTTTTIGLIEALKRKNISVQSYKIGPDYIDTAYLTYVSGRTAYNLDFWLMGKKNVQYTFFEKSADADISIIEGVMGLFDGGDCSTAEMVKLLNAPVLLCINCEKIGESISAIIEGFINFDRKIKIAGLILAKVSGSGHYELLKEAIEKRTKTRVLGYLIKDEKLVVKERHLGLTTIFEKNQTDLFINNAADQVEQYFDLEKILDIAFKSTNFYFDKNYSPYTSLSKHNNIKVAYSFDNSFNFFYHQNIDILKKMGVECAPFSPLNGKSLDSDIDLLILWGGFPEIFAKQLSDNKSLKKDILNYHSQGMPIYAECGGFIYLCRNYIDSEGKKYPMLGIIPVDIKLSDRLKGFGYKLAQTRFNTIIGNAGIEIRGHEFHHSYPVEELPDEFKPYILKSKQEGRVKDKFDGFADNNLFASYLHINFIDNQVVVNSLVKHASFYKKKKQGNCSLTSFGKY
ncbi:MAG: cobyrinate a,c-diamide synthase [Actinobacteria bacterium]|nr:cobyrinate a,c-diamide synthase [Actinomycetota bacterium]